jgi:hypothetical protein
MTHTAQNNTVLYSHVACTRGGKWWVGIVTKISDDNDDTLVKFLYPEGLPPFLHWPEKEDICPVDPEGILKVT